MTSPLDGWVLSRRPATTELRAFDAADELLLEEWASPRRGPVLVVNDSFGALALAAHEYRPTSWSDSAVAHLTTADNLVANGIENTVAMIPSTEMPATGNDTVLWRVPRNATFLRQQVWRLHDVLSANATVLVGGMDKHLPAGTTDVLRRLGAVTTLPGRRKAHVFRIEPDPTLPRPVAPAFRTVELTEYGLAMETDANVFAPGRLDIGAERLIAQLERLPNAARIADLGCGVGVLGLVAQRLQPGAHVDFFDESYQAIAATQANHRRNFGARPAGFTVADGLVGDGSYDVILCNPPFHQQHVIGDQIAGQMFAQSHDHLRSGGQLWVVANRDLGHHNRLTSVFGNCTVLSRSAKFVVLTATRR